MAIPCGVGVQFKAGDLANLANQNEIKANDAVARVIVLEAESTTNKQEHNVFNSRITAVENSGTNIGTINTQISQLETAALAMDAKIDDVITDVDTNTSSILDITVNELPAMKADILAAGGGSLSTNDVENTDPISATNKLQTEDGVDKKIAAIPEYVPIVIATRDVNAGNMIGHDNGGTSVKDIWTKRDPGDITLLAGSYTINAEVPGTGGIHQARLVDGSGNVLLYGTVAKSTGVDNSYSLINGQFTLPADGTVAIETIHDTDIVDVGLGIGSLFAGADSVYTSSVITKIS